MNTIVSKIFDILKDYHSDYPDTPHKMSEKHIIDWANQFGDDAEFILEELLHFLANVYVSKEKAKSILKGHLEYFMKYYKYSSMDEFIKNVYFIDVQKEEKSQKEILVLVKEILLKDFGIDYDVLVEISSKKHYIYFDDVLATGGTVYNGLLPIIQNEKDLLINGKRTIALSLFCLHTLGYNNIKWKLSDEIGIDIKIFENIFKIIRNYVIENQLYPNFIAEKQKLNCAYPIEKQNVDIIEYINSLSTGNSYEFNSNVPTFRPEDLPLEESFFTSKENRVKFEEIILRKGLELIKKVKKEDPDPSKRPLGHTVKSHKTLGLGTLFFTWRNISNTCPVVFWWDVPTHDWLPLFPLKNRGK